MECFSLFRYFQKQIRNKILKAPTGSKWHLLELLVPRVGDLDGLLLAHPDATLRAKVHEAHKRQLDKLAQERGE